MAIMKMDIKDFERVESAIKKYQGNAEDAINEVLHNEASDLIQESIRLLMPVSGRTWRKKKPAAKTAKSLGEQKFNLAIVVKAEKAYQYLYFPDDGTNTRRHVGNQQFFLKGAELKKDEIINRCVERLVKEFNDTVN